MLEKELSALRESREYYVLNDRVTLIEKVFMDKIEEMQDKISEVEKLRAEIRKLKCDLCQQSITIQHQDLKIASMETIIALRRRVENVIEPSAYEQQFTYILDHAGKIETEPKAESAFVAADEFIRFCPTLEPHRIRSDQFVTDPMDEYAPRLIEAASRRLLLGGALTDRVRNCITDAGINAGVIHAIEEFHDFSGTVGFYLVCDEDDCDRISKTEIRIKTDGFVGEYASASTDMLWITDGDEGWVSRTFVHQFIWPPPREVFDARHMFLPLESLRAQVANATSSEFASTIYTTSVGDGMIKFHVPYLLTDMT